MVETTLTNEVYRTVVTDINYISNGYTILILKIVEVTKILKLKKLITIPM